MRKNRNRKDSHVDNSVGDVDDENGKEVESFFVHQREVEEQGDCQGYLDKHYMSDNEDDDDGWGKGG